jgi:hypothetical protein
VHAPRRGSRRRHVRLTHVCVGVIAPDITLVIGGVAALETGAAR